MTATGDTPSILDEHPSDPPSRWPEATPGSGVVHQVCPYLQGEGGGWKSLAPTRDHRCAAMHPPAEPSVAKQRELCLRPAHAACATFVAAQALEQGETPDPRVDAGLWPATQQSVLALEPARAAQSGIPRGARKTGGQALLAGLMVLAFVVLVVARTTPSGAAEPGASLAGAAGASQPAASAAPASLAPSPAPVATASPEPSAAGGSPSASPSAAPASPTAGAGTPTPPAGTTYTVKGGDTLSSIAAEHGVTVRQLRKANGLTDNVIHPGDELVIPAGG